MSTLYLELCFHFDLTNLHIVQNFSNNRLNAEAAKKIAPGIAKNKGLETLLVSSEDND